MIPGAVAAQSFSYDLNGNQTAAGPSGSQTTYGWDAADRLITITQGNSVTRFDYDGQSRRVSKLLSQPEKVVSPAVKSTAAGAFGEIALDYQSPMA